MKTYAGNLKKGEFILYQNEPWQIQKTEFYSPGKGSALMKVKIKNVVSGKNIDYTFKSNETVETLEVQSSEMQYLYKDGENLYFMDQQSYNQYELSLNAVGDVADYLKDGEGYYVYMLNDKPLTIRPPASVRLTVTETEDAAKGDTVSGGKKPAVLETGTTVQVPLFIKVGDVLMVNPETGEYVERVKG
jgi:elongation factor P